LAHAGQKSRFFALLADCPVRDNGHFFIFWAKKGAGKSPALQFRVLNKQSTRGLPAKALLRVTKTKDIWQIVL
jgi:hypothetical protein